MGVLPVLIIALAVIQWSIGLLVIMVNHTRVGAYYYGKFINDQIALFDETGKESSPSLSPFLPYHASRVNGTLSRFALSLTHAPYCVGRNVFLQTL